MKSRCVCGQDRNWLLLASLLLIAFVSAPEVSRGSSPAVTPALADTAGRLFFGRIPAPSVANNPLYKTADLPIAVYLPPSYFKSTSRYPAVYFLPGFGDRVGDFIKGPYGFSLRSSVDSLVAVGAVKEMILVIATGRNVLGGSFYRNSPVTGNWEDWIVKDVVGYVDSHYRTLPGVTSRGLAGHSMGGSGAIDIGMRHPELFGTVYSMSPGLFDPQGLSHTPMFETPAAIADFLSEDSVLTATPEAQRLEKFITDLQGMHWTRIFAYAYGAAFSPDAGLPAPHIRYPFSRVDGRLVRDEAVWKVWGSGFGDLRDRIERYGANLRQLHGFTIECGTREENTWIQDGCRYFSRQLDAAKIPHKLVSFEGGHDDHLGQRLIGAMIPFFSGALARE
jgi:enterochelin esterase-like enzyme